MEIASSIHRKQTSFSFAAAPITSGCGITHIGVNGIQFFLWRRPFALARHNAGWTTPVCLPTRESPSTGGTFTECLAAGRVLARSHDFSNFRSLVDVGGGSGGLAIAMAETWPNLAITIADLPAITPVAQRYVDQAGFATRIKVCPTNVVSDLQAIRYLDIDELAKGKAMEKILRK
jgi:O-methyltransferase domain